MTRKRNSTPAESTAESTPAESTPAESTPAESTPAESTPAESTPAESGPTISAAEWGTLAAFTPGPDGWPATLPAEIIPAALAGVAWHRQATSGVARGAALYSTGGALLGMYGTADPEQARADDRHRKAGTDGGHKPEPGHAVLIVGGGPVPGPDGTLSGRYSPRRSDRAGTPRLIVACRACRGGRAILG
jgi:hypothetical protein